jgi:two-component system sensor kinase FixL
MVEDDRAIDQGNQNLRPALASFHQVGESNLIHGSHRAPFADQFLPQGLLTECKKYLYFTAKSTGSCVRAHEINQPLGAILRNAEAGELFMQNASPDLDEVRAILADIRKDDQRAGAVIDRMRAFLKRHDLEVRRLDVGELIGDVVSLVRADAAAQHVKLDVDLACDLQPVRGDRVHLQQVLLNLILNGMDALNGLSQDDRRVSVTARLNGTQTVEIAVSDAGHGIPVDNLVHIFDPFFTTKPNGMGMGLPISRTIIEAHGGRLWAENNNGGGAALRFTLPVAEEAAAE